MKNARYWFWLQKSFGCGANIADIVSYFGSVKELYDAGEKEWLESGLFGNNLIETNPKKIRSMKSIPLSYADDVISYCERNSIGMITPEDNEYPSSLRSIKNFPAVLFFRGDINALSHDINFAVIGTRRPSDYGKNACKVITAELAKNGAVIISGGALGIDSTAHKTCVELAKPTVMVMGTGLDSNYLRQNEPLRQSVIKSGCIISEYAPKVSGSASSFPLRNRIVAALASGIIVFEAGEKSGTLNTCKQAARMGKPIFVLPGAIDSELYAGSNKLIDEGATPIFSAGSVFRYFDLPFSESIENRTSSNAPFSGIDTYTEINGEPFGVTRTERLKKLDEKKAAKHTDAAREDVAVHTDDHEPEEGTEGDINVKQPEAHAAVISKKLSEDEFSDEAIKVFDIIRSGKLVFDEIVNAVSLPPNVVMRALTELEMNDIVNKVNSLEYKLTD